MYRQLGLIGCGLIGGSFALALKRANLVGRVVGYSKSPSTTAKARDFGVIDIAAPSALLAVTGADLVLVAVPVSASAATFRAIRQGISDDALVMDVGSTKSDVVDAARTELGNQFPKFVGAHPIAGKEVAGVEHADADLFAQRLVVLSPVKETLRSAVQRAEDVWRSIGANVSTLPPAEHDAAFAAVSHLPHLLAFAFIQSIAGQADAQKIFAMAGTGFRDFSRIAASDPSVWRDVLLSNRQQVMLQSAQFRAALQTFEDSIASGNAKLLESMIRNVSDCRSQWRVDTKPPSSIPPT